MIKNLCCSMDKDVYFLYNNLHRDSIIDEDFSYHICRMIEENQERDDSFVVLHSKGGNLKSGAKIAESFKSHYANVSYYVPERCGSTATLLLLSGDEIYLSDASIVTPCDIQMDTVDGVKISVNDLRNYLEKESSSDLNPIDLARYYSSLRYFRDLVYKVCDGEKKDKIIQFMLHQNSHDYLIDQNDFYEMGIFPRDLQEVPCEMIDSIHQEIKRRQSIIHDHVGSIVLGPKTGYIFQKEIDAENRKKSEGYQKVDSDKILIKKGNK